MGKINIAVVDFREMYDRKAFIEKGGYILNYAGKYTQIAYDLDTGDVIFAVDLEGNLVCSSTDKVSISLLDEQRDVRKIVITVADLTDEVERRQVYSLMPKEYLESITNYNYTHVGINNTNGKIIFGVIDGKLECYPHAFMLIDVPEVPRVTFDNGKLSYTGTENIQFKTIGQVINNK